MKVLHIPDNIASQVNTTVKALRDIGVDARGIVLTYSPMQDHQYIESFSVEEKNSLQKLLMRIPFTYSILKAMRWADVIHWHFNSRLLPFELDLRYLASLKKACVVEFWGSDIRIPEIACQDNPYIQKMYEMYPEFAVNGREKSIDTQKRFAKYGFACLIPDVEMEPYVQKDIFHSFYRSKARILMSDFIPNFPDSIKKRPLIIHTPSRKEIKGTKRILEVIEQLKGKYEFDFQLIHNMPRKEMLEWVGKCDIMIDEIISGAYGLAAIEAMALGKPVVCYIKPSSLPKYSSSLPLVNANSDNLVEVLTTLLSSGEKRAQIGKASRAYVEEHHDAHKIAHELLDLYKNLLGSSV
ncbi:MAG: glycosyltransferase [Candidatus Omnitrophica bacterium]|nr:glycosyltransferase [Candidatus Omnitrophota bacterium]